MSVEAPARPARTNYVGGEWRPSAGGKTYEKRNPANPTEIVGEFPASNADDVEAAVNAAHGAFAGWAKTPATQRAGFLTKAADALERRVEDVARDMTREMGKPIREARMEAARGAQILRYFAGEAWRPKGEMYEQSATGSAVYTVRRPLGVVALITPWNFPAAIPLWKSAPASEPRPSTMLKAPAGSPPSARQAARCSPVSGASCASFITTVFP